MRILLIEDDVKAARLLARGLSEEGFTVDVVHSAEDGDEQASCTDYDVLIVDWMLPKEDGLSLCRQLRARSIATPIIMLTARDALADRVEGLNSGADDYLTKPFAFDELLARVRAVLRRSELTRPTVLACGGLVFDPVRHRATRDGQVLQLTAKEYAILEVLVRDAGKVVGRARLAEHIWKSDTLGLDNLIDSHMRNLRRKVDPPGLPRLIRTVRGRGFMLGDANPDLA